MAESYHLMGASEEANNFNEKAIYIYYTSLFYPSLSYEDFLVLHSILRRPNAHNV
jgi:hypothetical protein